MAQGMHAKYVELHVNNGAPQTSRDLYANVCVEFAVFCRIDRPRFSYGVKFLWWFYDVNGQASGPFAFKQVCQSSLLSGRNVRWPRRSLPPGELQ